MSGLNSDKLPKHIAIIMDGNGRWAKKRFLPRIAGHKAGVDAVRRVVKACVKKNIEVLTIFAFSTENWRRPEQEVDFLMGLFVTMFQLEVKKLHKQNIQVRVIGDRSRFSEKLQAELNNAEEVTKNNTGLKFVIAANYGAHWDICEAMRVIAVDVKNGKLSPDEVTPELIQTKLSTAGLPNPDLFIRTSGEQRISNFLLWQLAYSELYFTEVFWPDFDETELDKALEFYMNRERRFGYISEQLSAETHA